MAMTNEVFELLTETLTIVILVSLLAIITEYVIKISKLTKQYRDTCKELTNLQRELNSISEDNWKDLNSLESSDVDIDLIMFESIFRSENLRPMIDEINWQILKYRNKEYFFQERNHVFDIIIYHIKKCTATTAVPDLSAKTRVTVDVNELDFPSTKAMKALNIVSEKLCHQILIHE